VDAVNPNRGPPAGQTFVAIYGIGLSQATAVRFGLVTCVQFYLFDDNHLYAQSPPGIAGTSVDVTVVTPLGVSATSAADRFTYASSVVPKVYGLAPNSGTAAGGTSITINGTGFNSATSVSFGALTLPASAFSVGSDTTIVLSAPAGTASTTVDVTVATAAGTSPVTPADRYTWVAPGAPVINGVSPNHGMPPGGTSVSIFGSGFANATGVKFGTVLATNLFVQGDNFIGVTSPPQSPATVDVTVITPSGTSTPGNADQFTYLVEGLPAIWGISINHGPAGGGTRLMVSGMGFGGTTGVKFGATAATSFQVVDDNDLAVTSPPGTVSGTPVDLIVTTPLGASSVTAADRFTYQTPVTPGIYGVTPNHGLTLGGDGVSIFGTALTGTTAVQFGSNAATNFFVSGDGTIYATAPPGTAGVVDIRITTPGGTSAVGPGSSRIAGCPRTRRRSCPRRCQS
jgi:hypothetical protein